MAQRSRGPRTLQRRAGAGGDDPPEPVRDLARRDPRRAARPQGECDRAGGDLVGDQLARHPPVGPRRHLRRRHPRPRPRARGDDRRDDGHRQPVRHPPLDLPARVHAGERHRQRVHRGDRDALSRGAGRAGPGPDPRHACRERLRLAPRPLDVARGEADRMNRNTRRRFSSRASLGLMYALTVLALIPLGLVLWFTIEKGLPSVIHPQFFFNAELPPCEPKCPAVSDAGVGHAIAGTAIMVGLASLMAIPVGILSGTYLAEYSIARSASSSTPSWWFRSTTSPVTRARSRWPC